MKINDDNIGKFFHESLKDLEVQPDKAVWSSIKTKSGISEGVGLATKAIVAAFIITAVVVSSYFLLSENDDNQTLVVQASEVQAPVETPSDPIPTDFQDTIVVVEKTVEPVENNNKEEITKAEPQEVKPVVKKDIVIVEKQKPNKEKQAAEKPKKTAKTAEVEKEEPSPEEQLYNAHLIQFSEESAEPEEETDIIPYKENIIESSDSSVITFSRNPTICFGEDAILAVKGGDTYLWNTGANTSKIKVSPVQKSEYWVEVTDVHGNQIKHTFVVTIDRECTAIFVPSAFTPNSDGINDAFKAEGVGIQSFNMVIFNRQGQIVFESNNIDDAWDGSYRNSVMSSQVYFYKISYVDAKGNPHTKQGQVTLIR